MSEYVSERLKRLQREMNVLLMLKEGCSNFKKISLNINEPQQSTTASSDISSIKNKKLDSISSKTSSIKKSSQKSKNVSNYPICSTFASDKDVDSNLSLTPSQTHFISEKLGKNNEIEVFLNTDNPHGTPTRKQIIFDCDRKHMEGDKNRNSNPRCRRLRGVSAAVRDDVFKREKEKSKYSKNNEGSKQHNVKNQSKHNLRPTKKKLASKHKFIEETMSNTSKTIDMLQVQVQCSNANLQLLTAGRDFLAQTLQLLQVKYLGLRKEMNEQKCQNEHLKEENKHLEERLTVLEDMQKKVVRYEEMNTKIEQDKIQCEFMLKQLNTERERLLKVIDRQTKDITKLVTENKNLHQQVNKETTISLNHVKNCEGKITQLIHIQETTKNDTLKMRNLIEYLQKKKIHQLWENLRKEIQRLRQQNIHLNEQLKNLREKDEAKCKKIEQELMNFMEAIMKNEQIVSNERNNLLKMVEKLTNLIEIHKNRITQLLQINKQQEKLLLSQSVLLKKKEEELIVAEETNEKIKKRAMTLESQVEQLYRAMESLQVMQLSLLDNSCRTCADTENLKEDLSKTKSDLEFEKEKLRVKEKIIDDQQDTIKTLKLNLKNNSQQSLTTQSEDTDEIYIKLQKEKRIKKKLISEIEDLEWQKELLLQEISELKSQDNNSVEVQNKIKEQYRILSLLEDQVAIKHDEWQQEIENVNREKAQAMKVARFATQKLIETIQDFQQQTENQKNIHSKVIEVIHQNKDFDNGKEINRTGKKIRDICRFVQS